MSNVKLAIRVRPFTEKELRAEKNRVPILSVIDENTITITNVKVNASGAGDSRQRVRRYYADYIFDSACSPILPAHASQEKIFEKIGRQVLSTISCGQSACVLTYGQSSTGKTHTMMGSAIQPGLIPRICKALADELPLDITISFLEIYNERVQDLLAGEAPLSVNSLPRRKGNVRKDLRVREHPTNGPYVQNLRRVTVHGLESLLAVVNEGTRRRRTAATKRNSCSSRSHALLELVTPRATLHLADLAGSEKASWEGAAGGRQKEGSNINKSLVALSNVISALVNGSSGRGRFVPYRDSALTWLLKDCFTGGGSTFIIATVSPSVASYGESASTLRWAARARRLPRPQPPTSVVTKTALQAQLNQLLAELARHYIEYKPDTKQLVYDDKHWALDVNGKQNIDTESKIGNIMNLRYPKTEARNSESTPSSIASGSSDIISNMDKNAEISNEINKEIDKLFGPALERTRSGSDIEVVAPLRHKKRHFRSQEVLDSDKALPLSSKHGHGVSVADLTEVQGDESYRNDDLIVPPVSILYDNQRAEIIASVTERLYSKLKKNDAILKTDSIVDKKLSCETKNMQPLNELKICSNARQRLMEISKRALRNKRKIGIPAHTQTRKAVIRVKDQAVDIQTDLQPYVNYQRRICAFQQDVCTETIPMTPRLKEIAVGPKYSSLAFKDSSTVTDSRKVTYKSTSTMTESVLTSNHSTQTIINPPPRRKIRRPAYSKYLKRIESLKSSTDDSNVSPIININISPLYAVDTESQSSEDNLKIDVVKPKQTVPTTPDLLTNHNNVLKKAEIMTIDNIVNDGNCDENNFEDLTLIESQVEILEEFSDDDDLSMPRVQVDSDRKLGRKDYEDMIFGRNENIFPYNIKLSPAKERDESKRVIRFNDIDITPAECGSHEWQRKITEADILGKDENEKYLDSDGSPSSDSTNNFDSGSFLWNKCNSLSCDNTANCERKNRLRKQMFDNFQPKQSRDFVETSKLRKKKGFSCLDSQCDEYTDKSDIEYIINGKQKQCSYKYRSKNNTFEGIEKKIKSACSSLEASVNKYDNYLMDFRGKTRQYYKTEIRTRTPTEYLQHLIKLRREAVKSDCHHK